MFGNTGFHHPRIPTKEDIREEARCHADRCEALAQHLREALPGSPLSAALDHAARLLRQLAPKKGAPTT